MGGSRDTKQRVLQAACRRFAEKGYRETTVQDICKAARANVASVNYYFGSKQNLYRAVWEARFEEMAPLLEGMRDSADKPEKLLADYIRRRIEHVFAESNRCQMHMIIHREMGNPSEIHDELRERFLRPNVSLLTHLAARFLGVEEADLAARRAAFSIHSQLVMLAMARRFDGPMELIFDNVPPTPGAVDTLVDHVTRFAMAGLRAARRRGRQR
jgi:AcrR family transcriptional regulator